MAFPQRTKPLPNKLDLEETEKAYLAGLIDGEGTICVNVRRPGPERRTSRPQFVLQIAIGMCDRNLIETLYRRVGIGTFHKGTLQNPKHRTIWFWRLLAEDGDLFLRTITPYLILKRRQAELFMEMVALRRKSTNSYAHEVERQVTITEELRVLNKRGAA